MSVDEEFAMWPASQPEEWRPKTIGFAAKRDNKGSILQGTTCSPRRVDTYFDRKLKSMQQTHSLHSFLGLKSHEPGPTVYVSSVWNSYRKSRLCLLNFIYTCSERLHDGDENDDNDDDDAEESDSYSSSQRHILKEAQDLSESLAASIPFHLTRNPETFLVPHHYHHRHRPPPSPTQHDDDATRPNRPIGGLLLMYPLHVVAGLAVVPVQFRVMFGEHLAWIGRVMKIGQAALLADVSLLFFSSGRLYGWGGAKFLFCGKGNGIKIWSMLTLFLGGDL